jgi:hypothetical protein
VILMVEFHWVEKLELPYGVGHKWWLLVVIVFVLKLVQKLEWDNTCYLSI